MFQYSTNNNFVAKMNKIYKILDLIGGLALGLVILFIPIAILYYCAKEIVIHGVTSSPVEEMYHRQLVTTIDSILDARLTIEITDSDDITLAHDQSGRLILPYNYK